MGTPGLLLRILQFLFICIFVIYFVLTEAWYLSTSEHKPIDEIYLGSEVLAYE